MKIKFKKFEKVKSVPKDIPKSHNDDKKLRLRRVGDIWRLQVAGRVDIR